MANHASHAALPYPVKGARYTLLTVHMDADGDPADVVTPDSEVSKDGGAFADAAEEVTTITGSNGMGYITLTGAETDASMLGVAFKSAAGPKATLFTLFPRALPVLHTGTAQAGAAGSLTLAAGAPAYDLTGCIVRTTGGTGGGGTGGANNQARLITAYNTSTKVATVTPNWETTPDATTTYDIHVTEMAVNALMGRFVRPTVDERTLDITTGGAAGVDWGNVENAATTVALSATTVKTATDVETDTQDIQSRLPAALVSGRMDSSVGAMANNTLTAAALAADAVTELRSLVSGTADSGSTTTMVDADRTEADTDYWKGAWLLFTSGNITGQCRMITGFTPATDTITFAPATTQAVATQAYEILPAGAVNVRQWLETTVNALISGRLDANTQAMANDVITAAVIAADAITSSELALTAANKIRDTLLSDATPFAGANIDAAVSSRATPAQVNTEVLDVLNTDTFAEPGQAAPPATTTLATKIAYLYKFLRNRVTVTSSTISVYADNGTTVDQKSSHTDDGTTYDRPEFVAGP